jgi:drug/metabolite transporter (DMT)-like permease
MNKNKRGLYLALGTAFISGFSVFFSSFAAKAVGNPYIFTTAKNIVVALVLSLLILTPIVWGKLKKLKWKDWKVLTLIGLIGGSIPFLLFFKGLTMSSSVNSAFIHKTLFIWVTLLAIPFLKEKISKIQLAALGVLLVGNYLLVGLKYWGFGMADLMILGATLFWSVEYIIAKKALVNIDSTIIAWARMFFGSIIMVAFVLLAGNAGHVATLGLEAWAWIGLTACFLVGYVLTWYKALSLLPASVVTSVLVVASPITTLLNKLFKGGSVTGLQIVGIVLIVAAAGALFYQLFRKPAVSESFEQV